jgi:aminopeptidase
VSLNGYGTNIPWAQEAPEELLGTPAPIDAYAFDNADGWISIEAPENTRELTGLPAERLARLQSGLRPHLERMFTHELKWVGCQYPTPSLAQEAGLSLQEFEDFLYGACLLDWDASVSA